MQNSILIQNLTIDELTQIIKNLLSEELKDFRSQLNSKEDKEELLSREQVLELLQINASTLWHWQNAGKITAYRIANKCYYKRYEIMDSLNK